MTRATDRPVEPLERRTLFATPLAPDPAWGGDGFVGPPPGSNVPADIAGAADGSAAVISIGHGGTTTAPRQVIRYAADGLIDERFGNDGRFLLSFPATAVGIAPDGKVIVAGANRVLRLEANGDVDGDFGTGGIVTLAAAGVVDSSAADVRVAGDGTILVLHQGRGPLSDPLVNNGTFAVVTRLADDGDVDGSRTFPLPVDSFDVDVLNDTALTDDGGVVVGGTGPLFGQVNVIRLDANGAVDEDFRVEVRNAGGVALDALDIDRAGNVTLLTRDTLGLGTAVVTRYDPSGDEIARHAFARQLRDRTGTAVSTPDLRNAFVTFLPYEIARLTSGLLADGVRLDPDTGRLEITGTSAADAILVNRADPATLRVTRNGVRTFVPRAGVTQIALTGGAGDDGLTVTVEMSTIANGDAGNDVIQASGGDDRLGGGDGNDRIFAGGGKDVISGGVGADQLYGESGKDRIAGEGGKDKLYGGSGDDQLDGGASDDVLFGEAGADRLFGFRGNDLLDGGSSVDLLFGGADFDTAIAPGPDGVDAIERILSSINEI